MVLRFLSLASLLALAACARGTLETLPDEVDGGISGNEDPSQASDAAAGDAAVDADGDDGQDEAAPEEDAGGPLDDGGGPEPEQDAAVPAAIMSAAVGGTGGGAFDDGSALPEVPLVKSITLWTGDRVDAISLELRTGQQFKHGGDGGSEHRLELAEGEAFISARLCTGVHDGTTSVFYARFGTSLGREVSGGRETSSCTNFMAPEGRQIGGLFGRKGWELDALGFYYTLLP
jgi:hypothetical protein